MATIQKDPKVFTLINVFTVAPRDQERLIAVLTEATQKSMRHQPGFISASIHRSREGTRVVNYAQWRSSEDFEAMRSNPEAAAHMQAASALATFDPIVCEVAESIEEPFQIQGERIGQRAAGGSMKDEPTTPPNDQNPLVDEKNPRDRQGFKEDPALQGLKTPPRIPFGEDSGEWTRGGGSDPNATKQKP